MPESEIRTWGRRMREFPQREWVLVLVLTYAVISAVFAILLFLVAEGHDILLEEETHLRNIFEIVFFGSQIVVALVALLALSIAATHAEHMRQHSDRMKERTEEAVRARKATVYMEINSRFNSREITYSRLKLAYFEELHQLLRRPEPVCAFVNAKLCAMFDDAYAQFDEANNGESEYTRTTKLLSFLEDIGLLIERRYVEDRDIIDFMGGVINMTAELLEEHIMWLRRRYDNDQALYANALLLMKRASSFEYTTYNEEDSRPGTRPGGAGPELNPPRFDPSPYAA